MKIAVTGALGHIGSRFIRELPGIFPDCEIVMADNLSTRRYCSLFNLPAATYRFVEIDVTTGNLGEVINGASVVVHLAAITDAAGSFQNREQVETVNYIATVKVAEAAHQVGARLIHLSSTSVYGTQAALVDEDCAPEELKPQSPYAETKLREERFLSEFARTTGLRFVTCRFGTICGTSSGMRFHTAVNKFCWQAVMGQPLTVWTTAFRQKRPYLTLDDGIRAFDFIIKHDLFDGRVYNVLTENLTVEQIVGSIRQYVPNARIEFIDSAIMNQLSYKVSTERFQSEGFTYHGNIHSCILDTLSLLDANIKEVYDR